MVSIKMEEILFSFAYFSTIFFTFPLKGPGTFFNSVEASADQISALLSLETISFVSWPENILERLFPLLVEHAWIGRDGKQRRSAGMISSGTRMWKGFGRVWEAFGYMRWAHQLQTREVCRDTCCWRRHLFILYPNNTISVPYHMHTHDIDSCVSGSWLVRIRCHGVTRNPLQFVPAEP